MSRRRLDDEFLAPWWLWCRNHDLDEEMVSFLLAQYGVSCCSRYVHQLAIGIRHPSWKIAKGLSQVCDGELSAEKIMDWRRPDREEAA